MSSASPPAPTPFGAPSPELTEVDLLLRLARRWRRLGTQEAAEQGLSPHQERALLAVARLSRGSAEHLEQADGSAEHLRQPDGSAEHLVRGEDGSAEHLPQPDGPAEHLPQPDGSAEHLPPTGVRVSHLAVHLGIAPRSATEVADALEAAGLLTRSPDPTDRRAVLLALTEAGRHTVAQVRDRRRAAADAAVATLSATDRAELRRLLEALLAT